MSVTFLFGQTLNDGSATPGIPTGNQQATITAAGEIPLINASIAGSAANEQFTFSFTKTKLSSIVMQVMTVAGILHLYTNDTSGGSPQDTIVLTYGTPFVWHNQMAWGGAFNLANPFAGNVTSLYVSNPGSTAVVLFIEGTCDPTT